MSYRGHATVVQLAADRWRAVHVAGHGRGVEVVAIEETEASDQGQISPWIKDLASRGFPVKNTGILLDSENSSLRYHGVPPVPSWRLELILKYEVEEIAEKTGDTLSGGHMELVVPESFSEDTLLILGVGKDALIQPAIDQIRAGGGTVSRALPAAMGIYHAHLAAGNIDDDETVLLCDVQHTETQILVVRGDRLLFARSVGFGIQGLEELVQERLSLDSQQAVDLVANFASGDLVGQEDAVAMCQRGWSSQLIQMLKSSLSFCQAQLKLEEVSADRIRLSGAGASLISNGENLGGDLDCSVDTLAFEGAGGTDWTMLVGTAAAMCDGEERLVDLLPESERKRRTFRDHTRFLWAGVAALVIALGLQFIDVSLASSRAGNAFDAIKHWRGQISSWTAAEASARTENDVFRKREARVLQEIDTGRFYARILDGLRAELPVEISLDQIRLNRIASAEVVGVEVTLSGVADNYRRNGLEAIETLQRKLESVPGVERVQVIPGAPKSGSYPFVITVSPVDKMPDNSGRRGGSGRRTRTPFGGRG